MKYQTHNTLHRWNTDTKPTPRQGYPVRLSSPQTLLFEGVYEQVLMNREIISLTDGDCGCSLDS